MRLIDADALKEQIQKQISTFYTCGSGGYYLAEAEEISKMMIDVEKYNSTSNNHSCLRCGTLVKFPIMIHTACFETEVGKAAEQICDKYCRFPGECRDQDELDRYCDSCPLVKLMNISKKERN